MIIDQIQIAGNTVNFVDRSSTVWVNGRLITHQTELRHWVAEVQRYFAYKEVQRQMEKKKPYTGKDRGYKKRTVEEDYEYVRQQIVDHMGVPVWMV